jgi:hypothetical protein
LTTSVPPADGAVHDDPGAPADGRHNFRSNRSPGITGPISTGSSHAVALHAQFGGGTTIVFDPSMYARQLRQLEQETATVTNLAQQLKYMIKNTTGGSAGIWKSTRACSIISA